MTEALNRAPTGDSARGPGVDETPGPHPLTRRRPESSTSAHATSQASWFRFPRFSKSADSRNIDPRTIHAAARRGCVMSPVMKAALEYMKKGMSVIPIKPGDKTPLVQWEQYQHRR